METMVPDRRVMGAELHRLRAALGWSARALGEHLGCSVQHVRAWEVGRFVVPEQVLLWLRMMVEARAAHERVWAVVLARLPPPLWRVRRRGELAVAPRYIPPDIGLEPPTMPAEADNTEGGSPTYAEGGYPPVAST